MKKILSLTMALTMLGTALTGCGSKDAATKTPAENTQQEQNQTEKALALINTFAPAIRIPPAACWRMATSSTIWHTAPVRTPSSAP